MQEEKQQRLLILVIILIVAILLLRNAGRTVAVANRTSTEICAVHLAYAPDTSDWGADRLGGVIPPQQSRDINLPVWFGLFAPDRSAGLSGRALDCAGNELARIDGIDGRLFIWEVR